MSVADEGWEVKCGHYSYHKAYYHHVSYLLRFYQSVYIDYIIYSLLLAAIDDIQIGIIYAPRLTPHIKIRILNLQQRSTSIPPCRQTRNATHPSLSRHSPYACKKRHPSLDASIHLECLFYKRMAHCYAHYLFENCGARRAFFKPYFFLSFIRGSLVRYPAFLSVGLYSSESA